MGRTTNNIILLILVVCAIVYALYIKNPSYFPAQFTQALQRLTGSGSTNIAEDSIGIPVNVVALLHFNEAAPFADGSGTFNTLTANGNVKRDTENFKFGSSSLLVNGATPDSYVSTGPSPALVLGGDFTIQGWCFPQSGIDKFVVTILSLGHYTDGLFLRIGLEPHDQLFIKNTVVVTGIDKYFRPREQWHYFVVMRTGNTIVVAVDGSIAGLKDNTDFGTINPAGKPLWVGTADHNRGEGFRGNIDELRVVNGTAAVIDIPTAQFDLMM